MSIFRALADLGRRLTQSSHGAAESGPKGNPATNESRSVARCSDDVLERFLKAREAVYAYSIGEEVKQRRQIGERVVEALESFLLCDISESDKQCLAAMLRRNSEALEPTRKIDSGLADHLRRIDPEGFRLLAVEGAINHETLKGFYRTASRRHHPDVGGSNETMQRVNDAYSLFHEAIASYVPDADQTHRAGHIAASPESWEDWLFSVHLTLACVFGDDFAGDRACDNLRAAYEFSQASKSRYVGEFVGMLLGFGGVLDRTCRALGRLGMEEELANCAVFTSALIDRFVQSWLPRHEFDMKPIRSQLPKAADFMNEINVKLVITHLRQAENAFRLGKMTEDRFRKTVRKFEARADSMNEIVAKINAFSERTGFVLMTSPEMRTTVSEVPSVVISPVWHQDRFVFLGEDQKAEYLAVWAFPDFVDTELCNFQHSNLS